VEQLVIANKIVRKKDFGDFMPVPLINGVYGNDYK